MSKYDDRLELVDRLIANVRVTLKKGDADLILFAAELLRNLQSSRDELTRQLEMELQRKAVAA